MTVRQRSDFATGSLSQACASSDTILVSSQFVSLPAVASPNYMPMTVDPNAVFGTAEVVWITTHTAASASVTVTRQAEDSATNAERSHNAFEQWVVAATSSDFAVRLPAFTSATLPASQDVGVTVFETDTNQAVTWNGTAWMTMIPIGAVLPYAIGSAPNSGGGTWMVCDGSAISRTTFAALFALTGTLYGVGNGTTTFNIPDMRSRTPVGSGSGPGLTTRSLGAGTGEETHLLIVGEMPVHQHTLTDPNHNHVINEVAHAHTIVDQLHSHGPIAGIPPNPGVGGQWAVRDDAASNGLVAGPLERVTFTPNSTTALSGINGTNQTSTGITTATHATGVSMANTGSGAVHNNMQPFTVLNFIIKVI